jgi:hypothetical protein
LSSVRAYPDTHNHCCGVHEVKFGRYMSSFAFETKSVTAAEIAECIRAGFGRTRAKVRKMQYLVYVKTENLAIIEPALLEKEFERIASDKTQVLFAREGGWR